MTITERYGSYHEHRKVKPQACNILTLFIIWDASLQQCGGDLVQHHIDVVSQISTSHYNKHEFEVLKWHGQLMFCFFIAQLMRFVQSE
jgi:hypothetical protein